MSLEHKFEDGLDDGLWAGGHPIIINGYGVFDKDAKDLQAIVNAEIIAELERMQKIHPDGRWKVIDSRIKELKQHKPNNKEK